ncbi:hypothetical protein ABZP36_025983 [Zizania latifolia]
MLYACLYCFSLLSVQLFLIDFAPTPSSCHTPKKRVFFFLSGKERGKLYYSSTVQAGKEGRWSRGGDELDVVRRETEWDRHTVLHCIGQEGSPARELDLGVGRSRS